MKPVYRSRAGFSLVELMVSLGILIVVTVYLTDMLTKQSRAYEVVDQVTEVQQNMRAIGDLLEREIRVTGYMVDEAAAVCGVDNQNAPDVLYLTDSLALTMMDPTVSDYNRPGRITAGFAPTASSAPGTGMRTITIENSLVLDAVPAYDTGPPVGNDSDFRANAGVIVFDRKNPARGVACGVIQNGSIAGTSFQVNFETAMDSAVAYPDQEFFAAPANVYRIVNAGGANPQLQRNGMLLADDVEDLQFALHYDLDQDDVIDDLEYFGEGGTGGGAVDPDYDAQQDNTLLREIRLSVVVRSRQQDREFGRIGSPGGQFQLRENRTAPPVLRDQFRRRVLTMAVRPRNIGNRGVGG